jgi:HEAT repeat protein
VRSYALSNVIRLAEDGFVADDAVDVLLRYRHRFDRVLNVFSTLGPKAAKALPELRQRLTDAPDEESRVHVASTLASVGDIESALPVLVSAFRWDDPTEYPPALSWASAALGDQRPLPDGACAELERALDSRNRYVRDEAVLALCRGSSPNAKLAERVASVLDAPDENSRRNAARALGDLGHPAAVPPLLRVLDDRYETFFVRCDAAEALARLGETEHPLAFAAAHCRHPHYAILNRAIELLGLIAQHGGRAQAEPLLVELVGPGDDVDRHPERSAVKRELAVLRGEAPPYPHAADVSPVRSY